jgi:hypothetical protein
MKTLVSGATLLPPYNADRRNGERKEATMKGRHDGRSYGLPFLFPSFPLSLFDFPFYFSLLPLPVPLGNSSGDGGSGFLQCPLEGRWEEEK